MPSRSTAGVVVLLLGLGAGPASGRALPGPPRPSAAPSPREAADPDTHLARQDQNPMADKVSFPFKNVIEGGQTGEGAPAYTLKFQPIVAFRAGSDWLLVTRTIVPVRVEPDGAGTLSGLGDTNASIYLSPARIWRGLRWGVGPTFQLPTASRDTFGTGQWGAGPTVSAIGELENWTVGGLVRSSWSFAGDPGRPRVTMLLVQPIAELNLGRGWSIATRPEIELEWNNLDGSRWTVPVGLEASRALKLGGQSLRFTAAGYGHPVHPVGGALYSVQLTVTFLFLPRRG